MRRSSIYLHRSVRSLPMTPVRVLIGVLAASLLTSATVCLMPYLFAAHARVCAALLRASAIPILGTEAVDVFKAFGLAVVPITAGLTGRMHSAQYGALTAAILVLVGIYRFIPLARNFVIVVLILLAASAAAMYFLPSLQLTSVEFSQIWLRGEVLVWLLLPWVTAIFFVPIHLSWPRALAWMIGLQFYGFLWSAVRLTFCLGILSLTGSVFLPTLWFCLGVLADLVYIVVAYSIAVHQAAGRWGGRKQWQY